MSQYSETMGSFIRTGKYPLEADYIFNTEQDLVNFYNDPIRYTILHEGLLKIVRDDGEGNQALYWIINNDGNFIFKKLISFSDIEDLKNNLDKVINDLNEEIKERKLADQAIWGTKDATEVDSDLNNILKISEAIIDIKNELSNESSKSDNYYNELKKDIQDVVGTTETNILDYLQTLDYQNLTEISELLNKFFNTIDDSDNQINTLPELQKFLEDYNYITPLKEVLDTLYHDLLGDPIPNPPFRTLRGIEDFVEILMANNKNRMDNIQSELDQTQVGVGLSGDGSYNSDKETYYLKDATSVMNALKILDSLINEAINNCNLTVKDTNTVDLQLDKYNTETILQADVKISSESGNGIIPKSDGIYYKLSSTYEDGILKIIVNDNIVSSHTIGLSSIVKNAYYDPSTESLIFEFELHDGKTQILNIPVSTLIREWEVDNSNSNKVVELTKEEVIGGGADKLSADVRLFVDKYNILVKQGNTLYVKGTTDNLQHHDLNLEVYLDQLETSVNDISTDLTNEITRAKEAEEQLSDNLTDETNRAELVEQELSNAIANEKLRAEAAETDLTTALNNEIKRSSDKDKEYNDVIANEINRASNAEQVLTTALNNEVSRAIQKENDIVSDLNKVQSNLDDEVLRATNAEKALDHKIDDLDTKLDNEIQRSKDEDTNHTNRLDGLDTSVVNLDKKIDDEIIRAKSEEHNLLDKLKEETERASDEEKSLSDRIDLLSDKIDQNTDDDNSLTNRVTTLESGLTSEISRAKLAEETLQDNIDKEYLRADAAEKAIDHRVDDTNKDLADEIKRSTDKDKELEDRLNNLTNDYNLSVTDSSSIDLELDTTSGTNLTAQVKLSDKDGNVLQSLSSGVYATIDVNYDVATNKIIFTDGLNTKELQLSAGSIIDKLEYDQTTENLILYYTNASNQQSSVSINVSNLIKEWDVLNDVNSVITLTKSPHIIDGIDTISASLKISNKDNQAIQNIDGYLFVSNNAKDIVTDKGNVANDLKTLETNLNSEIQRSEQLDQTLIDNLNSEIDRSKEAEKTLTDNLNSEIDRAKNKEQELSDRLDASIQSNTLSIIDTSSIDFILNKNDLGTELTGSVIISDNPNNTLQSLNSGLYVTSDLTYNPTTNILTFSNGVNSKDIQLSPGSIINDITYAKATETLTLHYNDAQGNSKQVDVILSDVITDWEVTNSVDEPVELIKSTHVVNGKDQLSARLKVNTDNTSLLEVLNGYLYASNNSKDIVYKDSNVQSKLDSLTDNISGINSKFDQFKTQLESDQNNLETKVESKLEVFGNKYDTAIQVEVNRAQAEEARIEGLVDTLKDTVNTNSSNIAKNTSDINDINTLNAQQTSDIEYIRNLINGEITRSTTEDSNIKDSLTNQKTDFDAEVTRATTAESVLSDRIDDYINSQNTTSSNLNQSLTETREDLSDHIKDYGNPHRVTKDQVGLGNVNNTSDADKPISLAVQDKLNEINIELSKKSTNDALNEHLRDNTNPHNVTKEQVGLGNVDNTSDTNKPISLATQIALDKKSDVGHKHVMSDIEDLENLPIVKGFVEVLSELPEDPAGGDKYIMETKVGSGATRYTLVEYDGGHGNWNQKLLTTGTIACHINGDVWKLNSSGKERMLDVSDYVYFYNKIYDETKDLIEDIDWEENDETSDTNNQIRLKITYKTKYGDPNESEATNPYINKAVKYIDIDKARFLSNAYSRPAIQEDVNKGYATKIGEPLLILVMTTGDHITISLKDSLNIYDPVETPSINMKVSDWTGDPNDSYKVSANIKIATTQDQKDAISLHINNTSGDQGLYGTLHTSNTNSISLNPASGSNTQKTLTANLNINNSLNDNSDVKLTIDSSGLSAKIIWGEYD